MEEQIKEEISFFDTKDPRSLVNILTDGVKRAIVNLPSKWHRATDRQLRDWCKPTERDNQLRLAFWIEYQTAQDKMRNMRPYHIYRGICLREYFYQEVLTKERRVAWMVNPPLEYRMRMQELLDVASREMREVLLLPNRSKGMANTKLIAEKVKIFALLDNRVKGAVAQRFQVENKNMNMNVNVGTETPKTMAELTKEISRLDREIKQVESPKVNRLGEALVEKQESVIDVAATSVGVKKD